MNMAMKRPRDPLTEGLLLGVLVVVVWAFLAAVTR